MTDFLCFSCMSWSHEQPMCTHDPHRPCVRCSRAVGYRFVLDDGGASSPFKCSACQH